MTNGMHYHIIGIAGAGMSAVAHILLDQGHTVSGSDLQRNAVVEALERRGAAIFLGHDRAYVAAADALVVTSAAKPDHPEIAAARTRGLPIFKRADLWRDWSAQRAVIAVAGSHGKTTTTAMIALALTSAGVDAGFLIGGETPDLGTNARWGANDAPLVIEADEYDRTFLALTPQVAVITNVEWDHVDIYPTRDDYEAAFRAFAGAARQQRDIIVCGDDPGALRIVEAIPQATRYGIDEQVARDPISCQRALHNWMATNVEATSGGVRFEVWRYNQRTLATQRLGQCALKLPGEHHVRNALAAIAAAAAAGVAPHVTMQALASYSGARRRFELKGEANGVTVIDDYAHHPTEARATLSSARSRYGDRRIVAYLEPHTYSRTRALLDDWATALGDADMVVVGAIYAAREDDTLGIDSATLARRIEHPRVQAVDGQEQAIDTLTALLQPGDILLTLGAGDSYKVAIAVLERLERVSARP